MDLGDRGRRHRPVGEIGEEPLDRLVEIGRDHRPRLLRRKGGQPVLQGRKVAGDGLAQKIGPGGEALAELDEGRPHLLQGRSEALPRPARRLLVHERPRQAQERPRLGHELEGKERVVPASVRPMPIKRQKLRMAAIIGKEGCGGNDFPHAPSGLSRRRRG